MLAGNFIADYAWARSHEDSAQAEEYIESARAVPGLYVDWDGLWVHVSARSRLFYAEDDEEGSHCGEIWDYAETHWRELLPPEIVAFIDDYGADPEVVGLEDLT